MADDDQGVLIDGARYTMDDLSFREQREMREQLRNLAPDGDPEKASEMDILPLVIWTVKRRSDATYTVDQALDFTPGDLEATDPPTEAASPSDAAGDQRT